MITNIKDLISLYQSVYYLEDTSIVPLIAGAVIANRFPGAAVWLMLIGASSSGKSEVINAITDMEIDGKKKVWQISSLTENTFLSGAPKGQKDTSLLNKLGRNGIIVMKDFTTQLSQNPERAGAIFSQLREIYDGYYTKETGLGLSLSWKGKLNFIGGVTEKIFVMEHKYGGMGTRAINYLMPKVSRKNFVRQSMKNNAFIDEARVRIREGFSEYVNYIIKKLDGYKIPPLPPEHEENIIELSDFATMCRSATERDFKGTLTLTQSPEMPGRMANQMVQMSNVFTMMNDGHLPEPYRQIIYRLALDSVSLGRRWVLAQLAKYETATTSALASRLNYPSTTTREWLEDLNVFGICDRLKGESASSADKWRLRDEFRSLMVKYEHIEPTTESLTSTDDTGVGYYGSSDDLDITSLDEHYTRIDQQFSALGSAEPDRPTLL